MSSTAPFFLQQFTDNAGKPLSAGKLFSYVGGSTNLPKPTYYDKDLTTQAPNPIILDASGTSPQYFMESGFYKFEVKDQNDVSIATRDYISVDGGSSNSSDYKVGTSISDTNPDFLTSKIVNGSGMSITEVVGATRYLEVSSLGTAKVSMSDSAGYLDSKFTSSPTVTFTTNGNVLSASVNPANVLNYKVKTSISDTTPGYLEQKINSTSTIAVTSEDGSIYLDVVPSAMVGDHKVLASPTDFEALTLDEKIAVDSNLSKEVISVDGVIKVSIGSYGKSASIDGDIQGYLVDKIKGGSGITITTTEDETNGTVLWVNSKTNLWTPIKYVNTTPYNVLDTDGTIVMTNDARTNPMSIFLPSAGANYLGRTVVIRGSSQWAGAVIVNPVIGSSLCGSTGLLAKGYEKNSYTCFYNNDTSGYIWFNDSWKLV